MARQLQRDNDDYRPRTRRKGKRWRVIATLFFLAVCVLVLFLPQIITSRPVLTTLINRYAGLAPLQVEFERVNAGWFTAVSATGFQLKDGKGHVIAKVGTVTTEKGILNWIRNSSDLGTIQVEKLEAAVTTGEGTSNWERLLAPIIESIEPPDPNEIADASSTTGTIQIVDAKLLLTELGRAEQWVLQIPQMSVTLPSAEQVTGPIELQATIGEVSGAVVDSIGNVAAKVQQVGDAFEISAELQHLPVEFWHVVHARLPDIPIDEMRGRISAKLAGQLVDVERWTFDFQQLKATNFAIAAPTLVGDVPARLDQIVATGRASLIDSVLQIDNAQVTCDFGNANATATIPWPIVTPTAVNPFLDGAVIRAEGTIDLPKLALAAQSLMPMRDDTQLQNGTAQFLVSQSLDQQGVPSSRANLTLAGLRAIASGQQLQWNEPLTIELGADRAGMSGLKLVANASAEFFNLQGGGTIEAGQLRGNVNLDMLQQRLSQWVELPISTMAGSANVDLVWNMPNTEQLEAQGQLKTTPVTIATSVGGQMNEPAWAGNFSATARVAQGSPTHIERAKLELKSIDETLTVDLQEPLALYENPAGNDQPATFAMTLVGDLPNWKRRAMVWLQEPPELDVGGNINLAVGGRVDMNHVEIYSANWKSKPVQVTTPQFGMSEAEMIGTFKGRVDSSDLTRLQVEGLTISATSFSLNARDAASSDGNGRTGQAGIRVNLGRLLNNVNTPAAVAAVLPPGAPVPPPTAKLSASGEIQGALQWQVTSTAAGFALSANAEQLVILSQAPGAIAPVPLWNEPTLSTQIQGQWAADTGDIDLRSLAVNTDWCTYTGTASYRTENQLQKVVSNGQAMVETSKLSTKLAPMTGNQVQLVGTQSIPVDIQWTSSLDPNASMLAGLQAATRIGWEQARVVGVQVGKADVPVTVSAGQLTTAAEIPVSGGVLRWDIDSDLTAEELVIIQKPMTVLENVAITEEMSKGWLKYVTPLIAEATSVDGRLSLVLNQALLTPTNPRRQTVVGQLVMHSAEVGPGPLSNQIITMVKQIDAIRKKDFTQAVSSQTVWLKMPEQRIDFQMVEGRVIHRNLNVRVGDVTFSTAGSVDVSGQMDLLGTMPIPDDWVDKSPLLVGLRGQSLQFPMRGTLKSPQLDGGAIQQLGRQTVQGAAQGLLEKGLSRGFEKIFGGAAPTPTTPPITQP